MTEIKSSEQIMRGEFDILENIDSQAECDDYMDEVGHKRKWVSFEDYEKLRSELEEAKKDMQITRDTEEEINNKLLGKNSDLQKENEKLKKNELTWKNIRISLITELKEIKEEAQFERDDLKKQLSELNDFRKNIELSIEAYPLYNNVLADEIRNRLQHIKESLEGEE